MRARHACKSYAGKSYKCTTRLIVINTRHCYAVWVWSCTNAGCADQNIEDPHGLTLHLKEYAAMIMGVGACISVQAEGHPRVDVQVPGHAAPCRCGGLHYSCTEKGGACMCRCGDIHHFARADALFCARSFKQKAMHATARTAPAKMTAPKKVSPAIASNTAPLSGLASCKMDSGALYSLKWFPQRCSNQTP